jgi:hypothetical protein
MATINPGKTFRFKLGKTEIDANDTNKHAFRLAYFNTAMYWLVRILVVLVSSRASLKFLLKLLSG